MQIEIQEHGPEILPTYSEIPITFRVESALRLVVDGIGLGGFGLREEPVTEPWVKDYDTPGRCVNWAIRFDVSRWGFLIAAEEERAVGGAVLAFDTQEVHMLDDRKDLAVLWDLRVRPEFRGRGIGSRLFARAVAWARDRRCAQLKVETQNVNVPACRFYASRGCHLGAIHRHAYAHDPAVADEVMLLWYLDL
jgi:GNAT superfamily N-acetyltransferase